MKKGQRSIRNGIEDILFPMEVLNITQGDNTGSHLGTYATDNAGKDTGIDPVFAPCTIKIMDKWAANLGNDVFFESVNKVRFADGTIDYVCGRFIHDSNTSDLSINQIIKQGQKFMNEGTAGNATGNHCHMEFGKGKFYAGRESVQNAEGTWHLKDNLPLEKVCFMNGTIMKSGVADWKYLKDVAVNSSSALKAGIPESGKMVALYNDIRVRNNASTAKGNTGLVYNAGMELYYDSVVEADGWYWLSYISNDNGGRRYIAYKSVDGKHTYWKKG